MNPTKMRLALAVALSAEPTYEQAIAIAAEALAECQRLESPRCQFGDDCNQVTLGYAVYVVTGNQLCDVIPACGACAEIAYNTPPVRFGGAEGRWFMGSGPDD